MSPFLAGQKGRAGCKHPTLSWGPPEEPSSTPGSVLVWEIADGCALLVLIHGPRSSEAAVHLKKRGNKR